MVLLCPIRAKCSLWNSALSDSEKKTWVKPREVSLQEYNKLMLPQWRLEICVDGSFGNCFFQDELIFFFFLVLRQNARKASGPKVFVCLQFPDAYSGIYLCSTLLAKPNYFCSNFFFIKADFFPHICHLKTHFIWFTWCCYWRSNLHIVKCTHRS